MLNASGFVSGLMGFAGRVGLGLVVGGFFFGGEGLFQYAVLLNCGFFYWYDMNMRLSETFNSSLKPVTF